MQVNGRMIRNWMMLIATAMSVSACSVTRLLPKGALFYEGATVEIVHPDSVEVSNLKAQLEAALAPTPTGKFRSRMYLKFKTEKEKGFRHFLSTQLGLPPVYYDPQVTNEVEYLLEGQAINLGYLRARVDATPQIDTSNRTAKVRYTARVGVPYTFDTLYHDIRDSSIARIVRSTTEASTIRAGASYTLDALEAERSRIQNQLRQLGYYFVRPGDFEFLVDTIASEHQATLLLKLKEDVPPTHLRPQRIRRMAILSDYDFNRSLIDSLADTTHYEQLDIICAECPLRPEALSEAVFVRPGNLYSPLTHQRTLERMNSFNMFDYINLSYDTVPGSDSLLDARLLLAPRSQRTIEGELGVVFNSGQYVGPEAVLTYINRNLFRGAEYLQIDGNFNYNFFIGGSDSTANPSFGGFSLEASVNVPRMWIPNRHTITSGFLNSNTRISIGFETEAIPFPLNNPIFIPVIDALELNDLRQALDNDPKVAPRATFTTYSLKYGYNWQPKRHIRHETNPLVVRFQSPSTDEEALITLLRNTNTVQGGGQAGLLRLERMTIFSPDYTYLVDTRLKRPKRNHLFWRPHIAMNFNRLRPVATTASDPADETSTYVQLESDLRYYHRFREDLSIATRLRAFAGYPFSRRAIIPYFDLYTVGGANSMRAFRPRGLGPGNVVRDEDNLDFYLGYGNILVEANVELRQRFAGFFELALFTDIGNVWEYRTQDPPSDSDFSLDSFYQQLGVSTGIGLRLDFDFLLVRFDLAYPAHVPYDRPGDDGGFQFNRSNFVLAFGHPF